jgi:serine/threonine protein kinase
VIADRYELVREIGRGGMGAVWLGRDTVLGRAVALKRIGLMPGVSSPDLERAEREARLAARLNHPHVVAVYDLVEEESDTWLVMEYVEGITLSAFVKRDGPLTPDEAAPLLRQAADALSAAHEAGIIHRDVKPSNILVNPEGQVKLTDFGIARAEADASLTQTGLVTGSPAYLAPEVASGSAATDAADVWSLGATLYHVLAGHPPYDVHDNVMGALYRIVHEEPPRVQNAGWLAPVLENTMTRVPADRWSMRQVRHILAQGHEVAVAPLPAELAADEGTRLLGTIRSEPAAVPPVPVDGQRLASVPPPAPAPAPAPLESTRPSAASPMTSRVSPPPPTPRTTRRSVWPWIAAAAVLVAVALIAGAAYLGSHGGSSPAASRGGGQSAGNGPTSPTSSDAADAAQMRAFITTYLQTVTADRHQSWDMLTPSFQQQSHGFGSYQKFWKTISSATPSNIVADPQTLTVSYAVHYVKTDNTTSDDQVSLTLERSGSSYLINGES